MKGGPLLQSDLVSDDSFIVDNGSWGIWVWVGKRASRKERTEAMRNAQGFIKKKGKRRLQGTTEMLWPGLVSFVPALAYHFCLALPAAFTQPGVRLSAGPCT